MLALTILLLASPVLAHEGHDHVEPTEVNGNPPTVVLDDSREQAYFTDLPVVDQHGRTHQFYSDLLRDRLVLIHFIYTDCTDFCPAMTAKLAALRPLLDEKVVFISISTNPTTDTPEVLQAFAERHGADDDQDWLFLTGDENDIQDISQRLGQVSEDYWEHSTLLIAGNVPARAWTRIPPQSPLPAIAMKLSALAEHGGGQLGAR
ncbi:SCO family protein [Halomonas urumqiensis]|nr:SCO family protein [Halomonas urumqiensis]GHE20909.1 SCO family protein [Halomonas urumqiensis]